MIGKAIKKAISGTNEGFLSKVVETVTDYFPDPKKKAEITAKLQELELERKRQEDEAIDRAANSLDSRIEKQEGTAEDLRALPLIGRLIIFARGAQRPIWGYATLWYDYQYFSGQIALSEEGTQLLWIINFLVLGFLFGERAIKNIMPLVTKFLEVRGK